MSTMNRTVISVLAACLAVSVVHATPSTTYWTPATTDVQPYRTLHVGIDNYFTVFHGEWKWTTQLDSNIPF